MEFNRGWLAWALLAAAVLAGAGLFLMEGAQYQQLQSRYDALNQSYGQDQTLWNQQREQLRAQMADLQLNVAGLQQQLAQVSVERDTQAQALNATRAQLGLTQAQLGESQQALANQTQTVQSLRSDFSRLQSDLSDSLAWFKDNSVLPMSNPRASILADRVMEDCVDGNELNLPCVNYVLGRTATIHYRIDTDNESRPVNHFQGINGTFDAGGGDCKDYSLLLKAVINTANARRPGLHLIAFQPGVGDFRVYPKLSLGHVDQYYYYSSSEPVDLGAMDNNTHVWVICFPYGVQGHCTVAVGGKAGTNGAPPDLSGARVFEPQDGGYMGRVGREFSVCDPSRQTNCWSLYATILLIIGDNDLYTVQGNKWNGYGYLLTELESRAVPAS
ncbi:Uncharacterised protein [uncultured archaeon]|nr:Uncharacterised protein [uncultured archaeon]